jgi:hypothetical protein
MNEKNWLDVGIRAIGVYVLFYAVTYFAESWLMYADYSRNPDINFRYYLIFGWIYALAGLLLLKAPGVLSNFAYPPESDDGDAEGERPVEESEK